MSVEVWETYSFISPQINASQVTIRVLLHQVFNVVSVELHIVELEGVVLHRYVVFRPMWSGRKHNSMTMGRVDSWYTHFTLK